ncbi:hypothetical protein H0H93_002112 [Arthromyces matolae]|nr:hypothetical protein H0H93_002112 [Arthromyces matolae]
MPPLLHSQSDLILAAAHVLNAPVAIVYACFSPVNADSNQTQLIDRARRQLLRHTTLLDGFLCSVHVGHNSCLYVFLVTTVDGVRDATAQVAQLAFDGLTACLVSSVHTLLPRKPLREIYSHFLEAIRIRLIDDIAQTASPSQRITRLKVFHPLSYSLPMPPGTPITLLPYGTPAFFLANYSGPTTALTKQFQESLQGLGAGNWSTTISKPSYIIAWVNVENKQGEDKGVILIYPTALCLAFPSSPIPARPSLDHIPSLPAALLPSPQISNQPHPMATSIPISTPDTPYPSSSLRYPQSLQTLQSSPTSDSLSAFRALTLSKSKDIRQIASEVAGYVDAVAREREKERERLKPPLLTTPLPIASQPPLLVAGSSHTTASLQNFYPSPPSQTNATPQAGPTSPPVFLPGPSSDATIERGRTPTSSVQPSAPPPPVPPPQQPYDPFGAADTSWSIQPQPYLGMNGMNMNMDMDMDFDMGIGMDMNMNIPMNLAMSFEVDTSSRNTASYTNPIRNTAGSAMGASEGLDFDDTAFTDDDFSFFDRPSATAPDPAPPPSHVVSRTSLGIGGLTTIPTPTLTQTPLSLGGSSPLFNADLSATTPQNITGTPWLPTATPGGVPDLLPPSPGPTPSSSGSAPTTPTAIVHLLSEPLISPTNSTFDPIPFADYHRQLDGKYASGKFSLPTPLAGNLFTAVPEEAGWRKKYMAATDPRIGVVRKLIGVKRKNTFSQSGPLTNRPKTTATTKTISSSWSDDWISTTPSPDSDSDSDSDSSASSSRTPSPSPSPVYSRPSTPLPSYLPLGATLLSTQFTHTSLLPLSTPLRRPSSPLPLPPQHPHPSISALTPVSPAATLGQSKSLEAAAAALAIEVVENLPWAEAWRASTLIHTPQAQREGQGRGEGEVWLADVRLVKQLLESVSGLEVPLTLERVLGDGNSEGVKGKEKESTAEVGKPDKGKPTLKMLEAPMITIGKGDAVIQVLPTALRFWEKLGLGPRGGPKDSTVFILFEDDAEQRVQQVEVWLESLAASYEGRHFGTLTPGKNTACVRDGLLPLRFDSSFRKTLASLITNLPASQSTIFLIVTPLSIMTLASPSLRQIFSAVSKASKTYSEAQIHFQFVPEQLIHGCIPNPAFDFSTSDTCCSIYDRILVPVDRTMSRRFFEHGVRVRKFFQNPALTLARPLHSKATFLRIAHAPLDIMDRDTFLHVGYQISPCKKWVFAACVDQRGEGHDLGVWSMQTAGDIEHESGDFSDEAFLVTKVWEFMISFAKKANVEWRVVFSKLGQIDEVELDVWTSFIENNSRSLRVSSITLLSVDSGTPWTFYSTSSQPPTSPPSKTHNTPRATSSSKSHPQNLFTDVTTTIFATSPYNSLPQSYAPSFTELGLFLSHVPEHSRQDQGLVSTLPHPLPLLPQSSTTLICVPANSSPTAFSMLHLHLLHITRPLASTASKEDISSLHSAITHNFHELAILARARWRLNVNPILPFHLAAVEAMRIALGRDQYGIDIADNCA